MSKENLDYYLKWQDANYAAVTKAKGSQPPIEPIVWHGLLNHWRALTDDERETASLSFLKLTRRR